MNDFNCVQCKKLLIEPYLIECGHNICGLCKNEFPSRALRCSQCRIACVMISRKPNRQFDQLLKKVYPDQHVERKKEMSTIILVDQVMQNFPRTKMFGYICQEVGWFINTKMHAHTFYTKDNFVDEVSNAPELIVYLSTGTLDISLIKLWVHLAIAATNIFESLGIRVEHLHGDYIFYKKEIWRRYLTEDTSEWPSKTREILLLLQCRQTRVILNQDEIIQKKMLALVGKFNTTPDLIIEPARVFLINHINMVRNADEYMVTYPKTDISVAEQLVRQRTGNRRTVL